VDADAKRRGKGHPVISTLNAAAVEALAVPVVRSRFIDLGLEIFPRERQTPSSLPHSAMARSERASPGDPLPQLGW
jgi:hypothetical protein